MKKYYYLIHIQYLGFRYHGWLRQPGVKTIELALYKTAEFVLGHKTFKLLGSSRTDAMVSADQAAFELFLNEPVDIDSFHAAFNLNLPNDIRVTEIEEVDRSFNIIQSPRIKEYVYLFAFGEKCHPFCAPLLCSFQSDLDIDLMTEGALLFQGKHNFRQYCTKPGPGTEFERELTVSCIKENDLFTASFFPKKSYAYHIASNGFLRYQVRLIMGQLLSLGRREIGLQDIVESLKGNESKPLRHIAPASGLILKNIDFGFSKNKAEH